MEAVVPVAARLRAEPLLALLAFRHYGYEHFPLETWGDWYGMAGAACILVLVASMDVHWAIKAWAMGEECLTVGCTAFWLMWPEWFTHAFASERCSQAVGFKIGSVGLMCLALITYRVYCIGAQVTKHNGQSDNE
jgi:hypothetical protein